MVRDFNYYYPAWGGPGVPREPKIEYLVIKTRRRGLEILNEREVLI
jgi:hypothetical protein